MMRLFPTQMTHILPVLVLLVLFVPQQALAALVVTFEETPLFINANVMPGDAVTRTVAVSNTGTDTQEVIFSLENTFSDGLAEVMELAVTSGFEVYVDNTFENLFTIDEIPLGTLAPGDTKTYEFTSLLSAEVGNAYQLTTLGFDLLLGFSGGATVTDNPPSGGGGGGGAGLGGGSEFTLFNEAVEVSDTADAMLTWSTNRPGTSYAVCGRDEDRPFVLDPDDELFGYVFASIEEITKSLAHTVEFSDLAVGDYSCRVASREDVDDAYTVSGELNFAILPGGQVAGISDSQPFIQGNYFQPSPTVAGVSTGGKGSSMTYEEYRAELDSFKAARDAAAAASSSTDSDATLTAPSTSDEDTSARDAGPETEEGSRWYLFFIGLILMLAATWRILVRQR